MIPILLIFLATIIQAYAASVIPSNPDPSTITAECVMKDVVAQMDIEIDPCNDFYQFACGGYVKSAKMADDKSRIGNFANMDDVILDQLKVLLEAPDQLDDPKSAQLVKRYYRSCMDTNSLEKLGAAPLAGIFKTFGGWPVVDGDNWNDSNYDWLISELKLLQLVNAGVVLTITVRQDYKNNSIHMLESLDYYLQIDQSGGQSFRKLLINDHPDTGVPNNETSLENPLLQYMLATALQLGANKEIAERDIREVTKFIVAMSQILTVRPPEIDYEEIYHPMTLADVQATFPELPFKKLLAFMKASGLNITEKDVVNIAAPEYLKKLGNLLKSFSNRVIANYQGWTIAPRLNQYLAPSLRGPYNELMRMIIGTTASPRWQECLKDTRDKLGWPVGAMYAKKYFPGGEKHETDHMVTNIRKAMIDTIEKADWMDNVTRSRALDKIIKLTQMVGFPAYINNETKVLEGYEKLELRDDAYMENAVATNMATIKATLDVLNKPTDKTEWPFHPATVNAGNAFQINTIVMPAGILQYPMYAPSGPLFVNYGRIGFIIGHEVTHGYDTTGHKFDSEGNLITWWTNETLSKFLNGATCFINQYDNITHPMINQNLDGEMTVGENIADNGGLKIAYKAYQWAKLEKGNDETNFTGLQNYTSDQLFFLAFAQTWCNVARKETLAVQILTDEHSPQDIRVTAPLRNNQEFADAYKCPVGSPMNPAEKCIIW